MKLLFDQNISYRITKKLDNSFPECQHISDCGLLNCDDSEIWEYAKKNSYSIVTFDADFYDISVINGHPPKIIWIRRGNLSTTEVAALITHYKNTIKKFIEKEDENDVSCLEIE